MEDPIQLASESNVIRCGNAVCIWFPILIFLIGIAACSSNKPYSINLMPAPDIYSNGVVNPFTDKNPIEDIPYGGVLYATDRMPADESDNHYLNQLGYGLSLGVGKIETGLHTMSWEEASRISLLKNRTNAYPLKVRAVEEIGLLDRSISIFIDPSKVPAQHRQPVHDRRYRGRRVGHGERSCLFPNKPMGQQRCVDDLDVRSVSR
jgi:hypothetical protein